MSSKTLVFRVNTPDGLIIQEDEILSITVPLASGFSIGIRPGHARLIAETQKGKIHIRGSQDDRQYELHTGVLTIWNNTITILTAGEVNNEDETISPHNEVKGSRLIETLVHELTDQDESD